MSDGPQPVPPEELTSFLRNLQAMDRKQRSTLNRTLSESIYAVDHAQWHIILDTDFIEATLDAILSGHLCGFSKHELTSFTDERYRQDYEEQILAWFIDIIETFSQCVEFLLEHTYQTSRRCHHPPSFHRMVNNKTTFVIKKVSAIWKALWEIRTPLLDSHLRAATMSCVALRRLATSASRLYQGMARAPTCFLPHVLLTLWVNATAADRAEVGHALIMAINIRYDEGAGPRSPPAFFNEINFGSTDYAHIQRAMLRDFRCDMEVSRMLASTIQALVVLRPVLVAPIRLDTALARQVFFGSLAACRTQMCMAGEVQASYNYELQCQYLMFVMKSPNIETTLRESSVHAIIPVIAASLRPVLKDSSYSADSAAGTRDIIRSCISILNKRKQIDGANKIPGPKRNLMRRTSAGVWRSTMDELRATRPRLEIHPKWGPLVRAWSDLGRVLEVDKYRTIPDPQKRIFTVLERCDWKECLCSCHEPLHRLRVCQGCWEVAYCNKYCQEKDWFEGNHRRRCRRLPTAEQRTS